MIIRTLLLRSLRYQIVVRLQLGDLLTRLHFYQNPMTIFEVTVTVDVE